MTEHYVSSKIVLAWEQDSPAKVLVCGNTCHKGMDTCNGYCVGKSERPPAAPVVPGYAVKYEDGYTSWSPKEAFEKSHVRLGHIGGFLPAHQRLLADRAEVARMMSQLPTGEGRDSVTLQHDAMKLLLDIMDRRIAEFAVQPCFV